MAYLQIGGKNIPLSEDFTPQLEIQGYTPNEPTFTRLPFTANFDVLRNAEIDEVFDNAFDGFQLRSARVKPYAPIPCALILGGNDALNGTGQLVLESVTPQKYVVRIRTNGTDFTTAAKEINLRSVIPFTAKFRYTSAGMASLAAGISVARANYYDWGGGVRFDSYLPQCYAAQAIALGVAECGYTLDTAACMSAAGQTRISKWMFAPEMPALWQHCEEVLAQIDATTNVSQSIMQLLTPSSFTFFNYTNYTFTAQLAGVYRYSAQVASTLFVSGIPSGGGVTITIDFQLLQTGGTVLAFSAPVNITANGTYNYENVLTADAAWITSGESFTVVMRATAGSFGSATVSSFVTGQKSVALSQDIFAPQVGGRYCDVAIADILPDITVQDAIQLISATQDLRVIIDDTTKTVYLSDLEYTRKAAPFNIGALVRADTANATNWYDSIELHSDKSANRLRVEFGDNDSFDNKSLGLVIIQTGDTTGENEIKYVELKAGAANFSIDSNGLPVALTLRRWYNFETSAYEVRDTKNKLVIEYDIPSIGKLVTFNDLITGPVSVLLTRGCAPASDAIAAAYAVGFSTLLTNYALYEVSMLADMDTMRNIQSNNGGVPNLARPVLIPPSQFLFLLAQTTNYDNDYTPYTAKLYPIE